MSRARIPFAWGIGLVVLWVLFLTVPEARRANPVLINEAMAAEKVGENPVWKPVDGLINERKFNEALKKTQEILAQARTKGDVRLWTEGLLKSTQLQMGLHGYETSVRFLKEEKWPADPASEVLLNLYYVHALMQYQQSYSWEIAQREKTASTGKVDLRAWTTEQIGQEIRQAFEAVLKQKAVLVAAPPPFFAPFINKNNYPAGIRPTLRDAVVYLAAQHLVDTTFWRPEQTGEIYKLPLSKLIRPGGAAVTPLGDEKTHPLVKLAGLLDSHREFHTQAGRAEAALEARYELFRRMHAAVPEESDKKTVREGLAELQRGSPGAVPWWSVGQADLAKFIASENFAGKLIEARRAAEQGYKAAATSVGGKMCESFMRSIEMPDFSITGMQSDSAGRPSFLVEHKNLKAIRFAAYAFDLNEQLRATRGSGLIPAGRQLESFLAAKPKPVAQWTAELPETPDFARHRTFVTPPLKDPGFYMVVATIDPSLKNEENPTRAIPFFVSDLVLSHSSRPTGDVEVRVVSGSTGIPVKGAEISLYKVDWDSPPTLAEKATSSADGLALLGKSISKGSYGSYIVLAKSGKDFAFSQSYLHNNGSGETAQSRDIMVFTDRSVYRPTQKTFFKIVVFQGDSSKAKFQVSPGASIKVLLRDPNGQVVGTQTVKTNEFGSASGEFTIPTGRPLGNWTVQTENTQTKGRTFQSSVFGGNATIRVEEYKRPTFEARFKETAAPLRLNKPAKITGEAKYYFGLPVTAGQVRWRVQREEVVPWWWEYWGFRRSTSAPETVASGVSKLKEDGTFDVQFTPEADERAGSDKKDMTYRFQISADVTDEGGETRQANRSVRLGFVSVEARIDWEQSFFSERSPLKISLMRTNLDGDVRVGGGEFRIVKLRSPVNSQLPAEYPRDLMGQDIESGATEESSGANFATAGDKRRARWETDLKWEAITRGWKEEGEVHSGVALHGENGLYEISLAKGLDRSGVYRIYYETKDDFGATYKISRDFVVIGQKAEIAVPLIVSAQQSNVKVGQKARILVHSGLADQPLMMDVYRESRLVGRKQIISGKTSSVIEIPISEADRGGLSIVVQGVRDHQRLFGQTNVTVPWDNKQLTVEFASFRDKIRPGVKETFRVTVKTNDGKPVSARSAELLAYMYDRSLDLFASHQPPSALSIFPSRIGVPEWGTTLDIAHAAFVYGAFRSPPPAPVLSPDTLAFYSSYGIGGPGGRGGGILKRGMVDGEADMASDMMMKESSLAKPQMAMMAASAPQEKAQQREESAAAPSKPAPAPDVPPSEVRSNFSETAFWKPHLVTGPDGSVSFEFTAPDSVTAWTVWIHALTKDLSSGSVSKETKTIKELMVRPYVPRFMREGDEATFQVTVDNAGDRTLAGDVVFDIENPETGKSALAEFGVTAASAKKPFTVNKSASTTLSFLVKAPRKVGTYAVRVVARNKEFSDGELRPFPVLPSRMHLAQSRFVTLRDKSSKTMEFKDLAAANDPTLINDRMVVTVDAQLFYGVLQALPYLIEYPYECTEQTLNRFLSTGIVSSVFQKYPAVSKMAREFSTRKTQLEAFEGVDYNRRLALEESPWLVEAQGGAKAEESGLINVLDERIAKAERQKSLAKLRKAQLGSGAWPWFPGGPPDEFMTLYILHGFSRAAEFGVEFPKDMIIRGWLYMGMYFDGEIERMLKSDCCVELITFLNYTLSSYKDASYIGNAFTADDRKRMLEYSFKKWKDHSPLLKGYLALTLKRMGRAKDAELVWASVMDAANTDEERGTFWAAEERSWLWYNDTVESHAFALRTMMELYPQDKRSDGLVQWLFLNKKMNHWKSTRATAEAIYSLVHFLDKSKALGTREEVNVSIGGQQTRFQFEPEKYTGKKNQIVIEGPKIDPKTTSKIQVEKAGPGYAFASATWHFSTERPSKEDRGDFFQVSRRYFKRENTGREFVLKPLEEGAKLTVGDQIEVQVSLKTKHAAEYVHLRDPSAAGLEPESVVSGYKRDLGIYWYEETRDSGANFFFNALPVGEYTFKYRLRANMAGTFNIGPATVQSMYAPEFNAYSTGKTMMIVPAPK